MGNPWYGRPPTPPMADIFKRVGRGGSSWSTMSGEQSGATVVGDGHDSNPIESDTTSSHILNKFGPALQQDSDVVVDTNAVLRSFSSGAPSRQWDTEPALRYRFALLHFTNVRAFFGLSQTDFTMLTSDDPGGSYAGLQFSTSRADTNWQWMFKDGTTQKLIDTGVAPSANVMEMVVDCQPGAGAVLCRLYDMTAGGVLVSAVMNDENIPLAADAIHIIGGARTLENAVKSVQQYFYFLGLQV